MTAPPKRRITTPPMTATPIAPESTLPTRPPSVRQAAILLLTSMLLISPLAIWADLARMQAILTLSEMSMLSLGGYLTFGVAVALALLWLVYTGKNWARLTMAALLVLGLLPMLLNLPADFAQAPWPAALHALQCLLQGATLYLLFGSKANTWYRSLSGPAVMPQVSASGASSATGVPEVSGSNDDGSPVARSQFVTVTSWILIAMCSLAAFGALFMAAMLQFLVLNDQDTHTIFKMMLDGAFGDKTPPNVLYLFDHAGMIFALIALSFVLHLLAAVGLLQRKNWARLATIAFLALSIVFSVALGIGFHFIMAEVMQFAMKNLRGDELKLLQQGLQTSWMGDLTMILISVAPFVALIWRLLAPDIRREFTPPPRQPGRSG